MKQKLLNFYLNFKGAEYERQLAGQEGGEVLGWLARGEEPGGREEQFRASLAQLREGLATAGSPVRPADQLVGLTML